ncbi:hypothetical protein L6V77_16825 [Myxococcota bacterium]|nr:hypothetical protein [Myxococcota bacterium]
MKNRVLDGVYWTYLKTVYSAVIDMQGDSALAIALTTVSSSGTGMPSITIEGSYDMQNWSSTGITNPFTAVTMAPAFQTGVAYGIAYKYARITISGGSTGASCVVNVSCGTFDPN